KKDINVEIIREILRKISISPTKGKNKIIIIDDADYLNIASQNALLKTLEEPPEKVILILVTPNSQKLLPTIISRCLIKKFNLVSDNELREITQEKKILFWSAGRPGLARIYLEKNNELEKAEDILEDLKKIANSTISEKFSLAETWSKNTPELLEKLAQWMLIFRHSIISGENPLGLPAEKRVQIMIKTGEMMETLKTTNANTRLVMENLMLEF
ncbi:MAG TPA: AAA family ATPase, partial [Patescibacteria group bacterium]|nr:AAA family ATPase [Patescibacteria group bacterium]